MLKATDDDFLFQEWTEHTSKLNKPYYYLTHIKENIYHSNAPSSFVYDFIRIHGLKVVIMWDERQELYAGFTEFKAFLEKTTPPNLETIQKWKRVEHQIMLYCQEKQYYDIKPDYWEAYYIVKNTNPNIIIEDEDELDSLLRTYIKTPLKTDFPKPLNLL